MKTSHTCIAIVLTIVCCWPATAGAQAQTSVVSLKQESRQQRDQRMKWWREARFGMFVYWGLYAIPAGQWDGKTWTQGGMEWIQKRANVPADVYAERLLPQFKPKEGFAKEWADLAKATGCKYVVFTNKHHEGFALHDSAVTTFDAKDVTGRDLHKEIVDAVRRVGLRVGAYHSLWDWHHTVPEETVTRMRDVGRWMQVNGQSIYGTTASPFADLKWGRCTKQVEPGTSLLYLHVFDWPTDGKLLVPGLTNGVKRATLLDGGRMLTTSHTEQGMVIQVPQDPTDENVSVVVVEIEGEI